MRLILGGILSAQLMFGMTVGIDIGHSSKRGGAYSCTGKSEYTYNKRLAKELGEKFKEEGIKYIFINHDRLKERVKEANKKVDMFISIHHDSVKEKYLSYKGKQHYSNVFEGYSLFVSSKNRHYKDSVKLGEVIGKEMRSKGLEYTSHHNEPIKGENRPWVNKEIGLYNFKDLIVLKGVNMPAVLVEAGIIVNEKEEKKLNNVKYRKKIVDSIVEGVKEYENR